ncbi:MAG TPA: DNA double-strand break repair nuclease NurA [Acidimicrobiia bacterium]
MRVRVDTWDPDYGASSESDMPATEGEVVIDVERPEADWAPIAVAPGTAREPVVLFVDGVRRTDALGWIDDDAPCTFASYAAGVVRCDAERASVVEVEVDRGIASASPALRELATRAGTFRPIAVREGTPEQLNTAVQAAMTGVEVRVSFAARAVDAHSLLVVDGPLRERRHVAHAVGMVKRHHVRYLGALDRVVGELAPGQRTPVFLVPSRWSKYSWYVRLPGPDAGPWSGIVRVEAPGDLTVADAVALAERSTATLPRYASAPHKDGRAPQNLYPIGGLERALRRRLGDPGVVYRALRRAAVAA